MFLMGVRSNFIRLAGRLTTWKDGLWFWFFGPCRAIDSKSIATQSREGAKTHQRGKDARNMKSIAVLITLSVFVRSRLCLEMPVIQRINHSCLSLF